MIEKKLNLKWNSDKNMIALFSNIDNIDKNKYYLLMVYHKSMKGGFSREISIEECNEILKKHNSNYSYMA